MMRTMKTNLPHIFDGQRVTILAGGPSLEGFEFSRIHQPVIAINDAFLKVDSAVLVANDPVWEKKYTKQLEGYNGCKVSYQGRGMNDFHEVEIQQVPDYLTEDWYILKANLSGFFALSLAFHLGAGSVVLLGFDGGYTDKSNWYENISSSMSPESYGRANELYGFFFDKRDRILNVGLGSEIDTFHKIGLEEDFYA